MALHIPKAPGVPQMLKDGARVSLSYDNQKFTIVMWSRWPYEFLFE